VKNRLNLLVRVATFVLMAKHGCVIEDNDTGKPSLFYYCLLFWDKNNWNSIWPEAKIRTKKQTCSDS
jgi:hypothetical protein